MDLLPQDVVVLLKLVSSGFKPWTYAALGHDLALSPSQVFRSIQRCEDARLLDSTPLPRPIAPSANDKKHGLAGSQPNRANLKEFLVHGVKYAFPVERGGMVRGIPTAHAAPPLNQLLVPGSEPPPVWPSPAGSMRGTEFSPLYKNVPEASQRDPELYKLLALVDAIRDGRARERELAITELAARIDAR